MENLVRHIDSAAISDLIVRVLDSPESNDMVSGGSMYGGPHQQQGNKRPTQEALDLLANADIFGRLADCFVKASMDHYEVDMSETEANFEHTKEQDGNGKEPASKNIKDGTVDVSTDALLGKHRLETSLSERPAQKLRPHDEDGLPSSGGDNDNSDMSDTASDSKDENHKTRPETTSRKKDDDGGKREGEVKSETVVDNKDKTVSTTDGDKDVVREVDERNMGDDDDEIRKAKAISKAAATTTMKKTGSNASIGPVPAAFSNLPKDEAMARRRRLREETMANVTMTMLGLTERMLQLPELGCAIPERLSVFATPIVVSRLIDAGIYARCKGTMEMSMPDGDSILDDVVGSDVKNETGVHERAVHVHRVETFSSGGNSALMHALRLAANLISTEANVYRDLERDSIGMDGAAAAGIGMNNHPFNHSQNSGPQGVQMMMMMMMMNAGGRVSEVMGGAPGQGNASIDGAGGNAGMNKLKESWLDGDKLVPTGKLEMELAERFERLAQMLDEGEVEGVGNDSLGNGGGTGTVAERNEMTDEMKPLGSLRLMLAEYFVAYIMQASQETVNRITELGVPKTLLKLFDRYRWSSMLHGVITSAIIACLGGGDSRRPGRVAWFEAGLIPWMMEVWRRNSVEEGEMGAPRWGRCGYLGHLISIGTALKKFLDEQRGDTSLMDASKEGSNEGGGNGNGGSGSGRGGASPGSGVPGTERKQKESGIAAMRMDENLGGLPEIEEAERFREFADLMLMPALDREAKPLCDVNDSANGGAGGSDGTGACKEGEEATDVLVMGGIQFVEGLPGSGRLEDDEGEIKAVDTDFNDLDHFANEAEEIVESIGVDVDHDIPSDMRERMGSDENARKKSVSGKESAGKKNESGSSVKERDESLCDERRMGEREREDSHDSSSEDEEGSYIAFVDERKQSSGCSVEDRNSNEASSTRAAGVRKGGGGTPAGPQYDTGKLASQMGRMKMGDDEGNVASASLDGVVIEIDDEKDVVAQVGSKLVVKSSCDENELGDGDDDGSSDEDYEPWADASRALAERAAAAAARKAKTSSIFAAAASRKAKSSPP